MKKIIRINASSLRRAACKLNWYRTVVQGYKKGNTTNTMEFGSAIHVFCHQMFLTSGDIGVAMHAAKNYFERTPMIVEKQKKYLNVVHLMKILPDLWSWYQDKGDFDVLMTGDNKPAVEITFSNLYYEDEEVAIYLEGTIDKLGKFKGQYGAYAIGDWKSTSSWNVNEYLSGYELSTQLRFYFFNLKLYAQLNPDSQIATICKLPVGAFVDGIFLNGEAKTQFERSSIFFFKQADIDEFRKILDAFIFSMLPYIKSETLPDREGMINFACTAQYGKCDFFNVCAAPDDISRDFLLKDGFVQTEYTPLRNSEDKV